MFTFLAFFAVSTVALAVGVGKCISFGMGTDLHREEDQ